MKRFSLGCLIILLSAAASLGADESVRTVQSRLKAGGYYAGKINGVYDSETATAITRYQIRNGLPITGKLDSQTRTALGFAAEKPGIPTPKFGEDVWRYLRKSDQEYIQRIMAEDTRSSVPESTAPDVKKGQDAATQNGRQLFATQL